MQDGNCALDVAMREGHVDLVYTLIVKGVDVNISGKVCNNSNVRF